MAGKSTGLREFIKSIVNPVKEAINWVGTEIVKPILTLGGTFEIDETMTLASFLGKVDGYDDMSQENQQIYQAAFHQTRAAALAKQDSGSGFVSPANISGDLLSYGRSETDYRSLLDPNNAPSLDNSIAAMIQNTLGGGIQINDFSRENELNAFNEAFKVDPNIGEDDYSKVNIKIGDE